MSEYKFNNIKIEKGQGIGWLILNRPEKRNAMSPELHMECADALDLLADDDDVKVLVLTGSGKALVLVRILRFILGPTKITRRRALKRVPHQVLGVGTNL